MTAEPPSPHQLILAAATAARPLSTGELAWVLAHIAAAGFDPDARERVRGELTGMAWRGRLLVGRDRLPPAERHYLKHVRYRREWPDGFSLPAYLLSVRAIILDPDSGVFTSRYQGAWQIGIVRETRDQRGPEGHGWILVEYRLELGHWVSAHQLAGGLADLGTGQRTDLRWLRRPNSTSESNDR